MSRKASGRLYTHVLKLMQDPSRNGRLNIDDPELVALLTNTENNKSTMYRVAGYMYDIRKYANLDVKAIRVGRKVVGYELSALTDAQPSPAEPSPEVTEEASSVEPAAV